MLRYMVKELKRGRMGIDKTNNNKKKKNGRRSTEPQRAGSCEEVPFVLVKLGAIWPASEPVLEVIFTAVFFFFFITWQARPLSNEKRVPSSTCQGAAIGPTERNKLE